MCEYSEIDMDEGEVIYKKILGNVEDDFPANGKAKRMLKGGMFVCIQGCATISLDEIVYEIKEKDLVVYLPLAVLKVLARTDDLHGIIMAVNVDAVQPLITKITDVDEVLNLRQTPVKHLSDEEFHSIMDYVTLFRHHLQISERYAERNQKRFFQLNHLQMENVKINLVLQVIMAFSMPDTGLKNTLDRKDEIVSGFFHELRSNFADQHNVNYYAHRQCLSVRYFSTVVKSRTGQNPSHWIMTMLINEAKMFLTGTDLTVKEIAEKLNFPNQSYFGKWFKANMGIGPMEFKKNANKK